MKIKKIREGGMLRIYLNFIIFLLTLFFLRFSEKEDKKSFEYLLEKCDHALDMQENDEAIDCYLKALSMKPETKGIHEALGYLYLVKENYDRAEEELQKELELHKDSPFSRFLLGILYILKGDYDRAYPFIEEAKNKFLSISALKILPKQMPIYMKFFYENSGLLNFSMGFLLKVNGDLSGAEEEVQSALKNGYRKKDCLIQLFDIYIQKNEIEKAEKVLSDLEEDGERIEPLRDILSSIDRERSKDISKKVKFSIRYLKDSIRSILSKMNQQAISAIERGEIERGIELWKKALNVSERSFHINYNLALILFDLGKLDEARRYCKRAINAGDPFYHHWAYNLMGNIYYREGRYYEAINEYKKAIDRDKDFTVAHYNLGSAYNMLGEKDKAEREWRFVVEHSKERIKESKREDMIKKGELEIIILVEEKKPYFYSRKYLGFLYLEKGLKEKGIEEFEEALKIVPSDPECHYELGKIYMSLNNKEKAIYHFEEAIKNGTKNEKEAKAFLKELRNE
jgi:tetratricopeptide (TPR) repeat protein